MCILLVEQVFGDRASQSGKFVQKVYSHLKKKQTLFPVSFIGYYWFDLQPTLRTVIIQDV
jgi:hypothetical protein